uniref:Thioredoxin peroxidase n=1 Tax=Dugesia japonica TaxID=6161 RepID=M9NTZ9_DUGJA|nr:peroxiredoxin-1 [Dugesia japonica]
MTFGVGDNSNNSNHLLPSEKAPDFKSVAVLNGNFVNCSLSQYKGKFLVLFFYPLDFTFVCPTEIIAFSDRINEFHKRNCEIIGCSTDSEYCHLAWTKLNRKEGGLGLIEFPLLSDKAHSIGEAYGVIKGNSGVSFRGLFIIDDKSVIRHITINDMPIGRSVDEVLRLVDAILFYDANGEVCPANWKKGDKTIKPDVIGSKDYFNSSN